jgi:hypothetical protein
MKFTTVDMIHPYGDPTLQVKSADVLAARGDATQVRRVAATALWGSDGNRSRRAAGVEAAKSTVRWAQQEGASEQAVRA